MKHSDKVRYPTQTSAIRGALKRSRRGGAALRVYRCYECQGWHLTSQPKRRSTG